MPRHIPVPPGLLARIRVRLADDHADVLAVRDGWAVDMAGHLRPCTVVDVRLSPASAESRARQRLLLPRGSYGSGLQ